MERRSAVTLILVLVAGLVGHAAVGHAQDRADAVFEEAYLAWDRGDYVPALEGFARVLGMPGGDRYFERIALVTGELHPTVEVAPDGRAVRFSPDGRWAAYETGSDDGVRTHVLRVDDGGVREVATIPGSRLVFSPDGERVAYLSPRETPERARALAELERAVAAQDRAALSRARAEAQYLMLRDARVVVRELSSGRERTLEDGGLVKAELAFAGDGRSVYVVAARDGEPGRTDIYALTGSGAPAPVTAGAGYKGGVIVAPGGRYLVYSITVRSPVPERPGTTVATRASESPERVVIHDLATGEARAFPGRAPSLSADGTTAVFLARDGGETRVQVVSLAGGEPVTVKRTTFPVAAAALSPDGGTVVFQAMPREDWELFLVDRDGSNERQLTRDVQHDLFARFIGPRTILAVKGEGRHRRSYLYDAETLRERRLFHNNTVRTIAPEYEWAVSPDGTRVLIVSERDGDTISPERGVYLVDLSRTISRAELEARLAENLAAERELRERGREMFAPIMEQVRAVVAKVSRTRLWEYQDALHRFGSKHITQPGNRLAAEYLHDTLRSWGYDVEYQWFEPRPGIRTANVVATLPGTEHPELVYVVGSHYDSVERGPGADDNTSGTSVLLETARVLRDSPLPATVQFVFFTGEEAGLLGSREFVRRALADGTRVVGALNNDMIGYANDHRIDNTIRYSNDGIRDLQHAAAFLFSRLVTYDARYYKSTDAHALFDGFGDVIGGVGSYPVLANPHYHQSHDVLETVDQTLIVETTKMNVASIMGLASMPSRVAGLELVRGGRGRVEARWAPAAERGVREYIVAYGPVDDPFRRTVRVREPRATLAGAEAGWIVSVKAVDTRGLVGWDWTRASVPR